MAIHKVKISNFKCFKGLFELELNKGLNILVGNNETGKSTILEAIHIALTGIYGGRNIKKELSQIADTGRYCTDLTCCTVLS